MISQPNNDGAVNVHSLICHRDVELSLHCLRSLEACSQDPVRIVLHDDGSLTESDREKIEVALKSPIVISRREADEAMVERLRNYPAAALFRRDSVWGLKLLDIVLLEEGACFYCDGDIRFFRPFRGLFTEKAAEARAIFLRDTVWEAYSVRPWHLLGRRRLRLMSGINTGLTIIDRQLFDLEFVDWFLRQPDWRCIPAWTEPTCWAALGWRANGHVINPAQLVNMYPETKLTKKTVGGHFLASYRRLWSTELFAEGVSDPEVSEIDFQPGTRCSAFRLAASQIQRKVQNTLMRWRAVKCAQGSVDRPDGNFSPG